MVITETDTRKIMNDPFELRKKITSLSTELESAKKELGEIERRCQHDWNDPVYTPEHHEAHRIPGDPPGTMGVDWRGPLDVPAKTIPKWTRTCKRCGMPETTTQTEVAKVRPKF
jgi:hypothetical protein